MSCKHSILLLLRLHLFASSSNKFISHSLRIPNALSTKVANKFSYLLKIIISKMQFSLAAFVLLAVGASAQVNAIPLLNFFDA